MEIKRTDPYKLAFLFLFMRKKYIESAMKHLIALNIERGNSMYRSLHAQGLYPAIGWEAEAEKKARVAAKGTDKAILNAFIVILLCSLVALLVGFASGRVDSAFEIDYGLASIFGGTFMASWATFIVLSNRYVSSNGELLHEMLYPVLFKLLFISGIFFIFLGLIL